MTLMPVHLNSGHAIDNDVVGHILSFLPSDSLAAFGLASRAHYQFTVDKLSKYRNQFFDAIADLGILRDNVGSFPIFSGLKIIMLKTKNLILDDLLLKLDNVVLHTLKLKITPVPEFLKNTFKVAEEVGRIAFAEEVEDSLELEEIALNLCNLGEHQRAYKAARKIRDENLHSLTTEFVTTSQKEIAMSLNARGLSARALRVALNIRDRRVKWEALIGVVETLKVTDPQKKRKFVAYMEALRWYGHEAINDSSQDWDGVITLVGNLFYSDHVEKARVVANSISLDSSQSDWLKIMSSGFIRCGRMQEASSLANDMRCESIRLATIKKIVDSLIKAGRFEEAEDVEKDVLDQSDRAISLRMFRLSCAESIQVVQKPQNQS